MMRKKFTLLSNKTKTDDIIIIHERKIICVWVPNSHIFWMDHIRPDAHGSTRFG